MHSRIEEMRDLSQRAKTLHAIGIQGLNDPAAEEQAIAMYRELKDDLALRMKAFNRLRFGGPAPWYELAYDAGIRHAHQAMIARSGSSPKNPKWHTAAQALENELDYYLAKLKKSAA